MYTLVPSDAMLRVMPCTAPGCIACHVPSNIATWSALGIWSMLMKLPAA
jgi:hypothetical protein